MKTPSRLLLFLLLIVGFVGCAGSTKSGFTPSQAEKIALGMSYEGAIAVLGSPGTEISRKNGEATYEWKNPDGTFLQLGFEKGRIVSIDINMIKAKDR